jgi:hypothetical protein
MKRRTGRPGKNLVGKRFGKLVVLDISEKIGMKGQTIWICKDEDV